MSPVGFLIGFGTITLLAVATLTFVVIMVNRKAATHASVPAAPAAGTTPPPPITVTSSSASHRWISKALMIKSTAITIRAVMGIALIIFLIWAVPQVIKWASGYDWTWSLTWPEQPEWVGIPDFFYDPVVWFIIIIILGGIAATYKGLIRGGAVALIVILVFGVAFNEGTRGFLAGLDRRVNHGDWSEPADYVPRVYGGSLTVAAGKTKTVDVSGKIRVPIPVHHCLDISPRNTFHITWDSSFSNAYIEPISGKMERATIVALPVDRCNRNG